MDTREKTSQIWPSYTEFRNVIIQKSKLKVINCQQQTYSEIAYLQRARLTLFLAFMWRNNGRKQRNNNS